MTLFSIITVCYNEVQLERTCKSIVEQSFQSFEWIVIDGGSNKQTLDIFDKFKSRINYFVSEKDNGIYNAMNKGIKKSTGKYLNFMNAGDYFYNIDTLKEISNILHIKKDVEVLYGNSSDDVLHEKGFINFVNKNGLDCQDCIGFCHQAMFLKKTLFDKYGLYDENYKILSDWKFNLKLQKNNIKFDYIDKLVAVCDPQVSALKNKNIFEEERLAILQDKNLFSDKEFLDVKLNHKQNVNEKISHCLFQIRNKMNNKTNS